jgi:hypothetical protein
MTTIRKIIAAATGGAPVWNPQGRTDSLILPGANVVPGRHCESSAILNALRYLGYPVEECEITGGGGALAFLFQKGAFPFLGGRNDDMRERFFRAAGIELHAFGFGGAEGTGAVGKDKGAAVDEVDGNDYGWARIIRLLERGVPVVLRNDMRFLAYRYGGRRGPAMMSFGGHYVTLFGVDFGRDVAYVSDTEYSGLQEVSFPELHRARISPTRAFPPHGEFYWAERALAGFALDGKRLVAESVAAVIGNYRAGAGHSVVDGASGDGILIGLAGLARYPVALADMASWGAPPYLLPAVCEYMASNIETHGTGGAAFRCLYRDFLAREIALGNAAGLEPLVPLLDAAIERWHDLSGEFRAAAQTVRGLGADSLRELFAAFADRAEALHKTETAFYTALTGE